MRKINMATINRVILSGRLARDPEIKSFEFGSVAKIVVCVVDTFKTRKGDEKEDILFMDCEAWNKEADFAHHYLKKGISVTVEGRLKQERWLDKNSGIERTRIIMVADKVFPMERIALVPKETTVPVFDFTKASPSALRPSAKALASEGATLPPALKATADMSQDTAQDTFVEYPNPESDDQEELPF
jgi:single stranded DNA-binding protein